MCNLSDRTAPYWNSSRALAELKRDGFDGAVPAAAAQVQRALAPADPDGLNDRLTALGMMMAPNRGEAEASIWLAETRRLLGDLPADILADAIDEHVRTSKFLPTVAEIRARADPVMAARRRLFSQLDAMARLIASGVEIRPAPPKRDERRIDPDEPLDEAGTEQLNAMMAKIGATSRWRPDGSRYTVEAETGKPRRPGPARLPTIQDYVDLGLTREQAVAAIAERSRAAA